MLSYLYIFVKINIIIIIIASNNIDTVQYVIISDRAVGVVFVKKYLRASVLEKIFTYFLVKRSS